MMRASPKLIYEISKSKSAAEMKTQDVRSSLAKERRNDDNRFRRKIGSKVAMTEWRGRNSPPSITV